MKYSKKILSYWESVFDDWQLSGLTQREYCRVNKIKFCQFKNWRSKKKDGLIKDKPKPTMLPIAVSNTPTKINKLSEITLILPSKAKLSLSLTSTKELKNLLLDLGLLS